MSASDEALILARIRKYILVAQENYKNDKIMAANQILIDIDNIISASSDSIKLVIIKELDNEPFTKEIRAVGGKVQNLFTLMTGSTDWKVWPIAESESATDMKVSTHRNDHSGEFYFKVEGTVVGASKLALIAALVEIELYSTWMPLCAKSEVIHSLGPYRRLLKSVIDFILFRREVLLLGYGDVLPNGDVFLYIKSATEADHSPVPLPPPMCTRVEVEGGFILEELQPDLSTNMRCAVHRMSGKGSNCLNSDMITRVNARAGGDMELLLASGDDDYGRFGSCGSTVTDDGLTIKEIAHPVRRISGNSLPDMGQNIWKDRIGGSTPDALEAGSTYSVHSTHSQHDTESVSKHHSDEGQVKVTACFRIDPKLDFIPEWAFNLGVRNAISALIPMLGRQARQFNRNGPFRHLFVDHASVYNEIRRRLQEEASEHRRVALSNSGSQPTTPLFV